MPGLQDVESRRLIDLVLTQYSGDLHVKLTKRVSGPWIRWASYNYNIALECGKAQ